MINRFKPKSEFSRNVLTLMTGTAISQAIPIAISPILTRIYSPEDFGILALYMSIASLLSVIVTGRYEMAIMLPTKESDAFNIVILSLLITIFISLVSFVIIFVFNNEITLLLNSPQISNWLYFIPITVFLTGLYQSFNYWINKRKQYILLSKSKVSQSIVTSASNVAFGISGYTYGGLILGGLLGQLISTYILSWSIWKNDVHFFRQIKKLKIIALAKKYKKFPLINSLHAFVNVLKENVVNIFIAINYTQSTLGYYYFMLRIMKLPSGLLGSSIAQVFYREATDRYNKDKNIKELVMKLIKKLILISFIPIVLLYLFSEDIFRIVFGTEWEIAGIYAKAISPYIFFHFIASPLGMIPLIVNKQEKAFFWGLSESLLFAGIFIFGYNIYDNLETTLNLLSIILGIYFIIYFRWIISISGTQKNV